jgi:diguanylate cyclase (GGDEF)-like protein/PAS domain S-box-containing protein
VGFKTPASGKGAAQARAKRTAAKAPAKPAPAKRTQAKFTQDWLRAAIDALPEGIVFLDEDGRYILWNDRYAEIYKASADLFQPGARLEDTLRIGVARGEYPEAAGREDAWIAERLAKLRQPSGSHEQVLADGRWILIEEKRMPDGCTIGLRVDVTEIKKKEEGFRLLFEDNPIPMFLLEEGSRTILSVNNSARTNYGYTDAELIGRSIEMIYDEEPRADGARPNGQWRHRKADGAVIHAATFARSMQHDGRACVLLAAVDITERRRAEARLAYMARHDALTNLPNRTMFREKVEQVLASGRKEPFAILLFDLDHFKAVNDTLGHSVGDRLLQEVGRRVLGCVGPQDMVARLGGDEFAVVHAGDDVASTVIPLVERIIAEVRRPYDLENHQVLIGASVGIALAPRDGEDPERLLKNADLALYAAKGEGRGLFLFFEPAMDEMLQARRKLEAELRAAMMNGDLAVHYQPLVDLNTGKPSGYEALLRWEHEERGMVPPTLFVPLAEDTGLIGAIGQMVLQRACADAAQWPGEAKVAVNLSPIQFKSCNVLETVVKALASSGLPAHRLELEITEALLLERDDNVVAALNGLRTLGVGLSLDDFGTGYSSLSYLRAFPFTKIKIDQSFVKDVHVNADSQAIVRAILSLGRNLGLAVTAEGIENGEDLAFLIAEGCCEGQGYLFSAARAAADLFPEAPAHEGAPAPIEQIADWRLASALEDEEERGVG